MDRVPLDGRRPIERCALLLRGMPPAGNKPGSVLWFWRDNLFGQPHSQVQVYIRLPSARNAYGDAASCANTSVSARAVAHACGVGPYPPGTPASEYRAHCEAAAASFQL